jgi:hypothetical protein
MRKETVPKCAEKMAAVNVTLASVTNDNANSTIDSLIVGIKNDQDATAGACGLSTNGSPTPGSLLSNSSNITATAYGIANEPFAAGQQQQQTDPAVVNARTCTPGLQQPYNHIGVTETPARTFGNAVAASSNLNSTSSVTNFVDISSASPSPAGTVVTDQPTSVQLPVSTVLCPLPTTVRPFVSVASVAGPTGNKTDIVASPARPAAPANSLHALVTAPRVRINPPGNSGNLAVQPNAGATVAPTNFRTLAPRIVVNSAQMPAIVRVQPPPASQAGLPGQPNVVLPIRTTQGQLVNRVLWQSVMFFMS